ncbi:hypothetical protein BKA93DRAFT_750075 [Sparassis latifolia]
MAVIMLGEQRVIGSSRDNSGKIMQGFKGAEGALFDEETFQVKVAHEGMIRLNSGFTEMHESPEGASCNGPDTCFEGSLEAEVDMCSNWWRSALGNVPGTYCIKVFARHFYGYGLKGGAICKCAPAAGGGSMRTLHVGITRVLRVTLLAHVHAGSEGSDHNTDAKRRAGVAPPAKIEGHRCMKWKLIWQLSKKSMNSVEIPVETCEALTLCQGAGLCDAPGDTKWRGLIGEVHNEEVVDPLLEGAIAAGTINGYKHVGNCAKNSGAGRQTETNCTINIHLAMPPNAECMLLAGMYRSDAIGR